MTEDSQTLMLYQFATRRWEELATTSAGYPSWSRDGTSVYFANMIPGRQEPAICRIGIADRRVETIVSLQGIRRLAGWVGLTPDDSPMVMRDVGTSDIYALDWDSP